MKPRLSRTVPTILISLFLVDFLLRFLPTPWFTFRAWEAATRYPAPDAPFEANLRYTSSMADGNLAYFGNLPTLRQPHSEIFTTDAWGFRRVPASDGTGPFRAILVGDSFGAGSSLNDDQTFASRLSQRSGIRIYNAAAATSLELGQFDRVLHRLGMPKGLLIYEFFGQTDGARLIASSDHQGIGMVFNGFGGRYSFLRSRIGGFWSVSPLRILSERLLRYAQNGRVLPNLYRENVAAEILRRGDSMLFYPPDIDTFFHPQKFEVGYYLWLRTEMKQRGLGLLVVLVPNKFQTYQALLKNSPSLFPGFYWSLDDLETQLREAGIPVVNLRRPLAQAAEQAYDHGRLLYWRDDTHWNPAGVDCAVDAVLPLFLSHING